MAYQPRLYGQRVRTDWTRRSKKAEQRRALLVDYLSQPENAMMKRLEMAAFLGMQPSTFYKMFPSAELAAIEREALQLRRERYSPRLSLVDEGLLRKGAEGDPAAARLAYQRFEGWSEKQDVTVGADVSLVGLLRMLREEEEREGDGCGGPEGEKEGG